MESKEYKELKPLIKFIETHQLTNNLKLVKHLIILGISVTKQKLDEITNESIKLLANASKEKSIQQELKSLRKKVLSLEKHFQPQEPIKYHSQPKLVNITPKITECIIPTQSKNQKPMPFKHHLDDSEIKSILWNQYSIDNDNQTQSQHHIKKQTLDQQPIIPQYIPKNHSQTEIHPLSQRENSTRQQTQRSSHHSQRDNNSNHSRNSPRFKGDQKKLKENKIPQSAVPRHLKSVQSKIKSQIQQDREQYRSNHSTKEEQFEQINIANSSLNPYQNTPQNKLFQPCHSTHFGSGNIQKEQQIITERKIINLDEIAQSFLNSPFMNSQVKQRLFGKQESASHSSVSSNFSLFNPNNELKSFFQREYQQVTNSLSFQF